MTTWANATTGIFSDDFRVASVLDPGWTQIRLRSGGGGLAVGSAIASNFLDPDFRAQLQTGDGNATNGRNPFVTGSIWPVAIHQPCNDVDFELETRLWFDKLEDTEAGFFVSDNADLQSATHIIKAGLRTDGAGDIALNISECVAGSNIDNQFFTGTFAPDIVTLDRTGDVWTITHGAFDATITEAMTAARVGLYAAHFDTEYTQHTAYFDYFKDTGAPFGASDDQEDVAQTRRLIVS